MDTSTGIEPGPRAGRREWLGLGVLALPTLLLALDLSVLYLALPLLSKDLDANSTQQLWIIDIYGFLIAGFLITMGTLGDRVGRRRLLMIGGAAFAVASVIAAFSTSAEMLIVTRALLGIAGACLMPSTLALISNMFQDPKQQGTAIGIWAMCFMVGGSVGPLIGGLLLQNFWWGSVFLMNVPVMAVMLLAAPALLPEYRNDQPGRLDLISVALSLATILPVIYGVKELARDGAGPVQVGTIVFGLLVGVIFVRRQNRLADPLLDLSMLRNRSLTASLTSMLFVLMAFGGVLLYFVQFLQLVAGLSPFQAALWQFPGVLAMIISTSLAAPIAARIKPAYVIGAGMVVAVLGLLIVTQVTQETSLATVLIGVAITGVGVGPLMALGTGLVIGSVPPEKAGSAASMSETGSEVGMALGIATLGAIGTAVYRNEIADTIPGDLPGQVSDVARDSLAGASQVATSLPEQVRAAVLEPAQAAFVSGFNAVAVASAVLMIAVGVFVITSLRHVPPTGAAEGGDAGEGGEAAEGSADTAETGETRGAPVTAGD